MRKFKRTVSEVVTRKSTVTVEAKDAGDAYWKLIDMAEAGDVVFGRRFKKFNAYSVRPKGK